MDARHLQELIRIEQTYWWHTAKRALVTGLLRKYCPPPGALVEGGIGGGANLLAFQTMGYDVTGFDLSEAAVEHCGSLGLANVRTHDLQTPWPTPQAQARAVVLLDVIEHAADPVAVLRNAAAALHPEGAIVVTVPAIPSLFGPWDVMLGHHRRYTARLLKDHAQAAGLRTRYLSHWNAFALPPAWIIRTREKRRARHTTSTEAPTRDAEFPPVSAPMNALLKSMATAERLWMRIAPVPVGLSLVGVFQP